MYRIFQKPIFFVFLLFVLFSDAQKRLVVMGSSTALGTGASDTPLSWAGLLNSYFHRNTTDGLDTLYFNIAHSAYTTYEEMPTSFVPPTGRPLPDPNCNVTKALSLNPDVVIINLPTNDAYYYFSKKEYMDNLRLMYSAITSSGAKCYIATTQPRNFTDAARRDTLRTLVDSINNNFGLYSIDFWTDLVSTDGQNYIKSEVSWGDGIHVNDIGHNYLFIRVRDKKIFQPENVPLPLVFKRFSAQIQNSNVVLKWLCEQEDAGTTYEVQKSNDGINFQKIATIISDLSGSYLHTDDHPFSGKNYYRIKIKEPARESYSKIISVQILKKEIEISKLYFGDASENQITIEINSAKDQQIVIEIYNSAGTKVKKQFSYLNNGASKITMPLTTLASDQYVLSIYTKDGTIVSKLFLR